MFHLMRNDLEKYKRVYELSKELETMYSPFTPQNQYSEATLNSLPKRNEIIDLTKIMEGATHELENQKNKVHELEKDNRKLRGQNQKLENEYEELEREKDKYKKLYEELAKGVDEERERRNQDESLDR